MLRLAVALIVAQLAGLATASATGERPTISGRFSKDSVEVGDRVELIIDIEKDRAAHIGIPRFDDALTAAQRKELAKKQAKMSTYEDYDEDIFECIEESPMDTVEVSGRHLHLRKRYLLAAMETGRLPMRPAIIYFERNEEQPDTIYTRDTLYLNVARFAQLDTTLFLKADPTSEQGFGVDKELAMEYLDDEGMYEQKHLPFVFAEIRDYAIYGALIAIVLALVLWLVFNLVQRFRERRAAFEPSVPKLPPHVVANKALVELSHRKLWQNGKFKQYYTALASILRVYISERWSVGALEMTTDEIISALLDVDMPVASRSDLVAVLRTADMVKFAKAEPDAEENEAAYTRAYYFVENTKLLVAEDMEGKGEITIETKIE
ncbi:MAG: hypothetical protein J6R81_04105 [Alistipes sp.]|nr:hypothetical protein [Alistipes sp.]